MAESLGANNIFNVWLLSSFRFDFLVREFLVVLAAAARPNFFEARKLSFFVSFVEKLVFLPVEED